MAAAGAFRLGSWVVQPSLNRLTSDGQSVHLRPRTMDVLVQLALRAGTVVSRDELLATAWVGQHVEDEGLTHCVSEIRDALGTGAGHASLVETIPKRGYRLSGPVHWITLAPGPPHVHGVVVLPFEDLGPDLDKSFSDGLHEAVVTSLADVEGLRVVSRTSALLVDHSLALHAIAEKLNVSHVLEGAIRRDHGRLVVTMRLCDADEDAQVWHGSFAEEVGNSLDVQERTARTVAGDVSGVLKGIWGT